ncbi:MAG TPA: hypothetical protein VGN63_11690 [Flavisolibacter sp.]|jgi:hypothetical protein|nr:hypothetical protein [Flavisolibacter sp.]
MADEQNRNASGEKASNLPSVNTGNASNPAPDDDSLAPSPGSQLLDEKAEKYLREVASIEDVPDAQDQQQMDEALNETKKEEQ